MDNDPMTYFGGKLVFMHVIYVIIDQTINECTSDASNLDDTSFHPLQFLS